jgi:lysine-N-methylase
MKKKAASPPTAPKYFKSEMLVPKYVTAFQCTGGDCPDTCCSAWSINVDKETFQRYRREVNTTIKPLIQKFLVQIDKNSSSGHGKLNLREADAHCGMHSNDQMCHIQQQLGEDALSNTCYIYPRYVVQVGDGFEQSLTLSCPEAARLALTQDDAFEFVSAEFTTRLATTTVVSSMNGFSIDAMNEVRIFLIQLFQTPVLSNTERLVAIGWLCQQLDGLAEHRTQETIGILLEDMRLIIENGSIHTTVSQLNEQLAPSATLFSILFGDKVPDKTRDHQRDVLNRVRAGLGITPDLPLLDIAENYARGRQILKADGGLSERLLSRYLLNDLLRETFPWTQATAMAHYRRLLTRYGILKMMLAGIAANANTTPTESELVQTIQVFCRIYQHNVVFAERAEALLVKSEWTQLDRLYALLH